MESMHLLYYRHGQSLIRMLTVCAGRAGQENFIAKTYDYVMSDMALTAGQLKSCNRWGCAVCPVLLLSEGSASLSLVIFVQRRSANSVRHQCPGTHAHSAWHIIWRAAPGRVYTLWWVQEMLGTVLIGGLTLVLTVLCLLQASISVTSRPGTTLPLLPSIPTSGVHAGIWQPLEWILLDSATAVSMSCPCVHPACTLLRHACYIHSLPPVGIKPVARWDKATTTFLLSSFLDSMTVGWTLGVAKGLPWPPCVHRVKGVTDVLAYLNSTKYATGCADSDSDYPTLVDCLSSCLMLPHACVMCKRASCKYASLHAASQVTLSCRSVHACVGHRW